MRRHGLGLPAQLGQAAAAQQPEHPGLAPLGAPPAGQELALGDPAVGGQPPQRVGGHRRAETEPLRHRRRGERPVRAGVPGNQVAQRVRDGLGERVGHAGRQRHPEPVAQPARVLDCHPPFLPGHPDLDQPPLGGQLGEPPRSRAGFRAPLLDFHGRQRAQRREHVSHRLQATAPPVRREALRVPFRLTDDVRVQQFSRIGLAEQLGEQRRVQGQCLGPALGQRRVAVVHERAHVPEQQRAPERGRHGCLHLHQPHPPRGEVVHEADQAGHVEHVLQALADCLEHDRERAVLARHRQQLRRALPLLPQRGPPPRLPPRQQQCPGCALPEPGREQGGRAELGGDELLHLLRLQRGDPGRRRVVGVGHPDHDAVVGVQRLHVHGLVALAQPGRDRQRPRSMHPGAVGAVQHQPPVAELVPEPLHHQGLVVGQVAGGGALRGQVADQVRGGKLVQAVAAQLIRGDLLAGRAELPAVLADGPAELGLAARRVAVPERQPARLAGRGRDEHLVGGDVLDPPGARAEHEHVADPRLVHHLLVELADPPGVPAGAIPLAAREEHAEQPAVGDRPAVGDGQPLAARTAVQHSRGAVPDQAGPQPGELLAGVAAGQHVEDRLEHRAGQAGERRGPAHRLLQPGDLPVVHRGHRDDLLGEHVERVARHAQLLDRAVQHSPGHDRRLHQVALVLGEDQATGDVADVVARAPGALQPAGHRRRRLHLDDQVNRAHVDAELQAGRGHHGRQPPRLQRLLDLGALLPGHRAVVRAGDLGGHALGSAGLGHDLDRGAGRGAVAPGPLLGALGSELVEPGAEPLGQAPRVREDDRGPVRLDLVEHALLDVRPDRAPSHRVVRVLVVWCPGRGLQVGHVLDRDHDLQVEPLVAGRRRDRDRPAAAEERRHLLRRPHGRGQPNPLCRPSFCRPSFCRPLARLLTQGIQALQRQGQVRAALAARQRVHLVDDHGLYVAEGLPGLGGEQQEQRLGRGDQDVRRLAGQLAALVGGGVAGAHADPDVGLGQAKAPGGLAHPGQR